MIIDCISDLHGEYPELGIGDLLIIAGDLTDSDTEHNHRKFWEWCCKQSYKQIVVIGGNHDNWLRNNGSGLTNPGTLSYLCDSGMEFHYFDPLFPDSHKTLKIWGSPWTKTFPGINPHCCAFTVDTDEELAEKWALIPDDVDILVTHCPPNGILDCVKRRGRDDECTGSTSLRHEIFYRIKPKLHVFGHIHQWGGQMIKVGDTTFVNASHMNEVYDPVNKPVRIIL